MSDGSWTANVPECISACVGKKVVGVLFDACPVNRRDLAAGNKTLVFDDGTGLTFSNNGSYWREHADEIRRAVHFRQRELARTKREIDNVLAVAGVLEDLGSNS